MFAVLRKRNYALLWVGQIVSLSGDWLLMLALPFYIYQMTGSVLQTGVMYMVEMLPRILLGSVAGVFVDRWDRRWTMVVSDLARALVLLMILLVHTQDLLWLIYVVTVLQTIISQFFTPASMALIPTLVEEKELVGANSLSSFSEALTRLIGPPLGGILFAWLSITGVVVADSASFALSALMILFITLPARVVESKARERITLGGAFKQVVSDWRGGMRIIRRDRVVIGVLATVGIMMVGQGIINVLLVPLSENVLHGGSVTLGWIITAQGIGSLLGAMLVGQASKIVRPVVLAVVALAAAGSAMIFIVHYPDLSLALLMIGIVGVFIVGLFVTTQTLLQTSVEDRYRGRVFGAYETLLSIATFVGLIASTLLGDHVSTVSLFDVAGILTLLAALVAAMALRGARLNVGGSGKEAVEAEQAALEVSR